MGIKTISKTLTAGILCFAPPAQAQDIVTLQTRPGVTQSYFLTRVPAQLQAVAVLFPGGGGLIHLRRENDQIRFDTGNFLVRSRTEFFKRGVIAAIPDAPSDWQNGWGMSDEFRLGEQHFIDISAVVLDLKKRFPALPPFLIGTSRGSVSAAALAARFGPEVAGAVLSSTMFRQTDRNSKEFGPGLSRFDFTTIKIPLLLVHHASDQCGVTPYGDAQRLSNRYPLISVTGGLTPKSEPCDAFSRHGFYGKEPETVEQIVNWVLKRPFRELIE
jgi:Serine aminopeptidase, S33